MQNNEPNGEMIEYICAHCGNKAWTISILHDFEEDKTLLLTQCSNKNCLSTREVLLQAEEDMSIGWDTFDITGQGYDPEDMNDQQTEDMVN